MLSHDTLEGRIRDSRVRRNFERLAGVRKCHEHSEEQKA
jgi:hypothetical protein